MRVLYVVHQFFPKHYTGTERFTFDLCKQMQKMGYRVDVLTYGIADDSGYDYTKNDFLIKEYEFDGVPVTSIRHKHMPEDVSFDIFMAEMEGFLYELLPNYDLIHVFHPMRLGTVIRVAKKLNIPTILTLTDFWVICPGAQLLTPNGKLCYGTSEPQKCVKDCYGKSWADKLTRRFKEMKELVRMVDCIVAPTYFLASMIKNVLDVHIPVIPYGLDYRFVKDIPKKSRDNLTLGFIGSVLPHKGVHTLIKAIKLLDDNAVKVKIYGDYFHAVEYIHQLKNLADNDKRIEFTGKYDYSEISRILSELDMVVVPSIWWENAPFTIQTSFAYKTPVIASNLGGMSEVVKDGVNGFLFEAGNAENLAEVIRKITTNQRVLNSIRATIISPPRIEEVAFEYEKIYSDLIVKRSFKRVNIDHINNMKEIRKNFAISRDNFFFDFKNKTYKSIKLINMNNLKIITRISKGDTMFQGNLDYYFSVGMSALQCIEIALFIANKKSTDIKNILDFACGYGRVMRIIKAAFPKAVITACELDKEAVDYCAKTFCATPAYSSKRVSEIKIDDSFDLIWNGSLLTHLDSDLWVEYLRLFESLLNPNGILIFTVHGCLVADKLKKGDNDYYGLDQTGVSKVLKDYEDHGFGYANYCNQSDYGISISSPSWVLSCLENIPNLQVLAYVEHLWGNHQDVVICIKDFGWYRKRESKVDLTTMEEICLTPIAGKSQQAIVNINGEIRSIYKTKYDNDFNFDIDKRDEMYQFLVTHPDIKDPIVEYFSSGKSMLTNLQEIFEDIGYGFNQIDSFLDFASGHGRFTRFLIQKLSSEKITVSDIDKNAVDFCKKTFGVNGFYSVENPNRLIHNNKYDVIYVASLFSHLSLQLWNGWLKRLYNMLNEGGILIFSTHGMDCYSQVDDEVKNHVFGEGVIEKVEEGFLYKPILSKDYGTAFVSCDYVKKVIRQNNIGNIVAYYPQKLWDFQDIYIIQKEGQYETTDSKETIPFPRHVTIANTYKCNLKCIMCFKRFENNSIPYMQLPSMSDELIDKIIHELFPCIETFALTVGGEPLADKNYKKFSDAAKKFNVKLKLLTNGFFLNDFQTIKDILEVSEIIEVSMDALGDLYESIRIGSKFDIIDRNLKLLVNIRNKLGLADKVKIGLDVVLMKRNIEQLPDIISYASDIGLDWINTSHLLVLDTSLSDECLVNHKVLYSTIYDRSICVAQAKNVPLAIPPKFDIKNENIKPIISDKSPKIVKRKKIYCPFIYEQSWIQVNGDVNPCCNPCMSAIMGNIKKNSFEEVWNNENYSKLRDSFKTGNISECCKNCYMLYQFTDPDDAMFD